MMTTAVFALMWSWAARGPDVVGADVAARTVTFNAEADDGYRGAVVATCRTYGQGAGAFAVVVFDAP